MGPECLDKAMKDLIQSFLDSAKNLRPVVGAIKEGNGHSEVYANSGNTRVVLTLPHLTGLNHFWSYYYQFAQGIKCCPNFVTDQPLTKTCDRCSGQLTSSSSPGKNLASNSQINRYPNVSSPKTSKSVTPSVVPTCTAALAAETNKNFSQSVMAIPKIASSPHNSSKFLPTSTSTPSSSSAVLPKFKKKRVPDPVSPITSSTISLTPAKVGRIQPNDAVTRTQKTNKVVQPRVTSNGGPSRTSQLNQISPSSSNNSINGSKPFIPQDPYGWTIEDVIRYLNMTDPCLSIHADVFRKHVSIRTLHLIFLLLFAIVLTF